MNSAQQPGDIISREDLPRELPVMLNVLTILTFIGAGFALLGAVYTYFTIGFSYRMIEQAGTPDTENLPGFFKTIMAMSADIVKKQYENRTLLFILGIVCNGMCLFGAIRMRQMKKPGFYLYTAGELIYPIAYASIIGMGGFGFFSLFIPVIMVVLYATQFKFLRD